MSERALGIENVQYRKKKKINFLIENELHTAWFFIKSV